MREAEPYKSVNKMKKNAIRKEPMRKYNYCYNSKEQL